MIATSLEDWNKWTKTYTMLPYVQRFPLKQTHIVSWERAWREAAQCSFVLESGKKGRYSFLGLQPIETISGKGSQATIHNSATEKSTHVEGVPLQLIKRWMAPYTGPRVKSKNTPDFIGGCVGYLGYDVVRTFERLPNLAKDDLQCPDYYFMLIDELWIVDHVEQSLYCAFHTHIEKQPDRAKLQQLYELAGERVRAMKQKWDHMMSATNDIIELSDVMQRTLAEHAVTKPDSAQSTQSTQSTQASRTAQTESLAQTEVSKKIFIKAVERVQAYIEQGDVTQVNLSLRQCRRVSSTAENIYEWLRQLNPSPYMGLLRFPDFQLVSGSPELLIKLNDGKVSTRPIGGTRRRGRDEEEDRALATELLSNQKENTEHQMLVDLECDDLSKIAEPHSVQVTDHKVLEYYSHVMHIVSQVEAKLAAGKDAYDVIEATFPGGTITGAPKVRTMEIIEELEPVRRGPYTGSIGWIGFAGDMELNITIRTLLLVDHIAYVQAGAGIVRESVAENEYEESLKKMQALWQAVQYSEAR